MLGQKNIARVLALALLPLTVVGAWLAGASVAQAADTSTLPTHFSSVPLASWRTDGAGNATVVAGDTVYVGGSFSTVLSPTGSSSARRFNLAAFSLTTGALISTFTADTNGQVRALAYDGTNLYVGGSFTSVNGLTRNRLAALDPRTGAVRTSWVANTNSNVFGLSVASDRLYASGSFTTVNNLTRQRVAAVSLTNGAVLPFSITADNTINTVAAMPDSSSVYIGGDFLTVNGTPLKYLVRLDATGKVIPMTWVNLEGPGRDLELYAGGTRLAAGLAGAGNQGALFDLTTGRRITRQRCDGDGQAIHVIDGSWFSGFHEACENDFTKRLTSNVIATGARDTSFQPTFDRFWGIWDIAGDRDNLVIAGDFTRISGIAVSGFAIFPSAASDTVAPTAPGPVSATAAIGSVALSWEAATDDLGVAGYEVFRDGVLLADVPAVTTFTDRSVAGSTTYAYTVRAYDGAANLGPFADVANATTPAAPPPPAFAQTWTAADGTVWPSSAWSTNGSAATADTSANRGRLALSAAAGSYARAIATGAAATTDSEVLTSYQVGATAPSAYFSVFLRGSGGWANTFRPRNGYGVQITSGSSTIAVQKSVNGTLTTLGTVSGANRIGTGKQWLRLRVEGSTIAFRTWSDGSAEPTTWTYSGNDSSVTAPGQLHFSENRSSTATGAVTMYVDDLSLS